MKHKLLFIDTETTGAEDKDRLIQVAYKTENGEVEVNELFKPELPITIEAMAVHHITQKEVDTKEAFKGSETYSDLENRFAKGYIFVAHNAPFDIDMVEREGLKVGASIDTLKLAHYLDEKATFAQYNLQYLRYFLAIEVDAVAHNAWGDILVLEQLFYRMLAKIMKRFDYSEDEAIEHAIEVSERPLQYKTFPFGKYRGVAVDEVAQKDPSYLKWLLGQKKSTGDDPDENWEYTITKALHL